jgi:hypothetical protein
VSAFGDARLHEYGIVTEQVTMLPVPRVTAVPATSTISLSVPASATEAPATHPICAVRAIAELTVIVKFTTIVPV